MKRRGRPVVGAISGLLFGLFVGLDLLFFGVVALDSIVLVVLPVAGLGLGIALGVTAPLRRGDSGDTPAPEAPADEAPADEAPAAEAPPATTGERPETEPV